MRFYSYNHENGIEYHHTPEEAKAAAQAGIDADTEYAGDGWHEEVTETSWGEVRERVVLVEEKPWSEHAGDPDDTSFDLFRRFELNPVEEV